MNDTARPAAPDKPRTTILDLLRRPDTRERMGQLVGQHMSPDRMIRLAMQAVQKTPKLLDCEPMSVLGAFMTCAALRLEPNTPLGHAYLIPYGRNTKVGPGKNDWAKVFDCQFQIGYKGFIELAYRSPPVKAIVAEAIREGDKFEHQFGSDTYLRHSKLLGNRGKLLGAYCHVRLADGQVFAVLPAEDIYKIRSRSQTYTALEARARAADAKSYEKQKFAETPWVMWEDDMAAKTAIKKLAKQLPLSPEMDLASAIDNAAESATLDLDAIGHGVANLDDLAASAERPVIEDQREETFDVTQGQAREKEPVNKATPEEPQAAAQEQPKERPVIKRGAAAETKPKPEAKAEPQPEPKAKPAAKNEGPSDEAFNSMFSGA